MTTIVNAPPPQKESGGNLWMVIGLVGLVIIGYLFVVYGLPALQNSKVGTPQISIPTQVVIPENVEVNVNSN